MSDSAAVVAAFSDCPFSGSLHKDIAAAGYETPTPIQARCLRPAMDGKDVLGLAQTGTGKTAAFALPVIHRLADKTDLGALILAPTRELVNQIVEVLHRLGRSSGLRVASLVGGIKISNDHRALRARPTVIVATPGRLIDHIERRTVSLAGVRMLIVDEADRMHDMGFMPQIRKILAALPPDRQTMMFTATMSPEVEQVARKHMREPVKISVGAVSKPVERAVQKLLSVEEPNKMPHLLDILKAETGRVLIFVRTKRRVDRLAKRVMTSEHRVARLHGDRSQGQRDEAMAGFRNGKYRVLVATDIAARGLDVADVEHVVNFDFPRAPEDYVHRIGRTARLEATGKATSFVTPSDREFVRDLEKLLGSRQTVESSARTHDNDAEAVPLSRSTGQQRSGHQERGYQGGGHGRQGHGSGNSHGSHSSRDSHATHGTHASHSSSGSHASSALSHRSESSGSSSRRRNRRHRRSGKASGSGRPAGHHGGPLPGFFDNQ
jgi:ATP-dependent RNA helicase RhlE